MAKGRYAYEFRYACKGDHSGRQHIYKSPNWEAAVAAATIFNQSMSLYTQNHCVPAKAEYRLVTDWAPVPA